MLQNGGRSLAALAIPWQTPTLKLTKGATYALLLTDWVIFWFKYPELFTTRLDHTLPHGNI